VKILHFLWHTHSMSDDSDKKPKNDPVGALAQELGVKVLSKADLPKEPHSLKKERPPILLLREVQQNFLIAKQQQNRKSK